MITVFGDVPLRELPLPQPAGSPSATNAVEVAVDTGTDGFPEHVPDVGFLHFRSWAHSQLNEADVAAFEKVYTRTYFARLAAPTQDEPALIASIESRIAGLSSAEARTIIRAEQAAHFRGGRLLSIPDDVVMNWLETAPPKVRPAQIEKVLRIHDPEVAAIAMLLLTGTRVADLAHLSTAEATTPTRMATFAAISDQAVLPIHVLMEIRSDPHSKFIQMSRTSLARNLTFLDSQLELPFPSQQPRADTRRTFLRSLVAATQELAETA